MSSSTQSQPGGAEAHIPELDQVLEAECNEFDTDLKQLFEKSQQSIINKFKNALICSDNERAEVEQDLQEEQQRVDDLTEELNKAKHNSTSILVKLAEERISRVWTKKALQESRSELGEAKSRVAVLERDLETAKQQNDEQLSTTLGAVNKRKADVEGELERSKLESANLRERLSAAEQQNVDLQATLKAAEQRASTAEKKLNRFNSMFKQINDDATTSATSSEQQPSLAQPLSSTPATIEQGVVEQSDTGQQSQDTTRPQSIDSQVGNGMSDSESDLLHCKSVLDQVMDPRNQEFNHYFLSARHLHKIANPVAKVGAMTLGTMREKLADGDYSSATSFKAEFYSMITIIKKLNPPENLVRIAAERLSKIFDQAFSSQSISGHKFGETAAAAQGTNEKKRKAESDASDALQDEPAQKRRSLASLDHRVGRKLSAGKRLGIKATLSSEAQLVSYEKSPSTINGDWKSLLPKDFWLTNYIKPSAVQRRITGLERDFKRDTIVLRLTPASETDRPSFDRILTHLDQKEEFATVNHVGINNVDSMYLIAAPRKPVPRAAGFRELFPTLNFDLLPPTQTEDMLFIVIVFPIAKDKRREVRTAWNERMAAVQNHDKDGLTAMRGVLARNPLPIFKSSRFLLTNAEHYLTKLNDLSLSDDIGPPELQAYGQGILRVSYPTYYQDSVPSVDGVSAPEWAFVLGRVNEVGRPHGLLIVDLQKKNRPVWLLRYWNQKSASRRIITLLADTFPGSLNEWQETIPEKIPTKESRKTLENTGVMLERCSFLD